MAVWKVARLGRVSSLTGEAFPPDTEVVTALFGEEEETGEDKVRGSGFARRDFLVSEATDERLEGAFCVWRTRTPPAKEEGEKRFDLGMAREFLERLLAEAREDRAAVCLTLALLLARKRRLVILDQDAEALTCRWPREKDTFAVPAPIVSEAEAETLQQDLMRLFDMEVPAEPEAAPDPGTEGGGDEAAPGEDARAGTSEVDEAS